MKKLVIALALVLGCVGLTGCTSMLVDHNEMILPSGDVGHSVTCNSQYDAYCVKRMGEECPNGYTILTGGQAQQAMATWQFATRNTMNTYYFICK